MSSAGGWEKVGGARGGAKGGANGAKRGGGAKGKVNGQQPTVRQPKLEEVLPLTQISMLQSLMPEDPAPPAPASPGKAKGKEKSAQAAQQQAKKKDSSKKVAAQEQTKAPKTVEEASKKVNPTELQSLLAQVKAQYPNNGILWLKDAASYFNVALNAETPLDLSNPFLSQPLSLLTKETKRVLTAVYEECGDQTRESAFDNLLANMAHDMGKNLCPNGYMVMLQSLAEVYPSLCVNNPQRFHELIRSYQNRPAIATALVWALGQGGRKDLAIGLKAWGEFIADLLQFKNYSRFVVDYLGGLLEHHADRVRRHQKEGSSSGRVLYSSQFFKIFDVIFGTGAFHNLNKQYKARLLELYPVVKAVSVGDCASDHELFPEFLRRLSAQKQREASAGDAAPAASSNPVEVALREECLHSMSQCLANNPAAVRHWQQMYASHLAASADLLAYLDSNWKKLKSSLVRNEDLMDTLDAFEDYNEGASGQKDGLSLATSSTKALLVKMSRSGGGSGGGRGWFPWKTCCLLLGLLLYYLVRQDIRDHGGAFERSRTGVFLKDVGLDQHALSAHAYVVGRIEDAKDFAEWAVPAAAKKAQELREKAGPQLEAAGEAAKRGYKWCAATAADLVLKVEEQFPGTREKLHFLYEETVKGSLWLWERVLFYGYSFAQIVIRAATAFWVAAQDAFNRIAASDDKLNETKEVARVAFAWTSARASEAAQWVSETAASVSKQAAAAAA